MQGQSTDDSRVKTIRWNIPRSWGAAAVAFIATALAGQSPRLVRDIRTTPSPTPRSGSDPAWITPLGNNAVFAATRPDVGRELFITDGTTPNPTLILDIHPGGAGSDPQDLVAIGNTCYFSAEVAGSGREIWKTDGTPAGTVMVKDIAPGNESSHPRGFVALGGNVYFQLGNGSYDVWRTDGTTAGTVLVRSFGAARGVSWPVVIGATSDALYFGAPLLYRSDGTAAGTVLVPGNYEPTALAAVGNVMFATVNGNYRLLRCTATSATVAFQASRALHSLVASGSAAYFINVQFDSIIGRYFEVLCRATPTLVTEFSQQRYVMKFLGTAGNDEYHSLSNDQNTTVYRNGSAQFAVPLRSIVAFHAGSVYWQNAGILNRATSFLAAIPGIDEQAPWAFLPSGIGLFPVNDPQIGRELFRTDGTSLGTYSLGDLYPTPGPDTEGSDPSNLYDADGQTYFSAFVDGLGRELFVSDGTNAGTRLVADLTPGPGDSSPRYFTRLGARVVFVTDLDSQARLWISDGTATGTRQLHGPARIAGTPISTGRHVFFIAPEGLWRTDGSVLGTVPLAIADVNIYQHAVGDAVYYTNSATTGLWCIRGTNPPTQVATGTRVYPIASDRDQLLYFKDGDLWRVHASGNNPVSLFSITTLGGDHVFDAQTTPSGTMFWLANRSAQTYAVGVTDGTQAGTRALPMSMSDQQTPTTFSAVTARTLVRMPGELFTTDGTVAGTRSVARIWGRSSSPLTWTADQAVTIGSRKLFFPISDGWTGVEMWTTDGTNAGTRLVADLNTGTANAMYGGGVVLSNGQLLFGARDLRAGGELWSLDVGAVAQPIGAGCASTAYPPELSCSDPIEGASLTARLDLAPANAPGLLVFGVPSPGFRHTEIGAGCTLYFDPLNAVALPFTTDAAGRAQLPLGVVPGSLRGARFMLQAAVGPTPNLPLGLDVSNGVLLVVGQP